MRQKRVAAFLDVDDTLLFGNIGEKRVLNTPLLVSLKSKGIIDIYLFTDMTFAAQVMKDRISLTKKLAARGFIVHNILTPCDITWPNLTVVEANRFKLTNDWEENRTYCKAEFVKRKKNQANMTQYQPERCKPGEAYSEALEEFNKNSTTYEQTQKRSFIAREFASRIAKEKNYIHVKGLMLDLFLRYKPDWVSSIVVFDDNREVIETMNEFKTIDGHNSIPMSIINEAATPDFEYYDEAVGYYNQVIDGHAQKDPLMAINLHIQQLKYGFNPFKSSPTDKITAWENLFTLVAGSAQPTQFSSIFQQWKKTIFLNDKSGVQTRTVQALVVEPRFQVPFFKAAKSDSELLLEKLETYSNNVAHVQEQIPQNV